MSTREELKNMEKVLKTLTRSLREAKKATEDDTEAEKESTKATEQKTAQERTSLGQARAAVGGVVGALAGGLADPMMLPSEMGRRSGRAAGEAVSGLPWAGPAMPFVGELLAAKIGGATTARNLLGDEPGFASRIDKLASVIQGTQEFLGEAEHQRYVEAQTYGTVRRIAERRASIGLESLSYEQEARIIEQEGILADKTWKAMQQAGRQRAPGDEKGRSRR